MVRLFWLHLQLPLQLQTWLGTQTQNAVRLQQKGYKKRHNNYQQSSCHCPLCYKKLIQQLSYKKTSQGPVLCDELLHSKYSISIELLRKICYTSTFCPIGPLSVHVKYIVQCSDSVLCSIHWCISGIHGLAEYWLGCLICDHQVAGSTPTNCTAE